jgi:hypothetical protein
MSDSVDAAMLAKQRTAREPLLDLGLGHAGRAKLRAGHHPMGAAREAREHLIRLPALWSHYDQKSGRR